MIASVTIHHRCSAERGVMIYERFGHADCPHGLVRGS
jgi:hypothetical protein